MKMRKPRLHNQLYKALREDEALTLLDDIAEISGLDWTNGGCLILCKALLQLFPQAKGFMVWNHKHNIPEHYVVSLDEWIVDGDGFHSKNNFLDEWASQDNYDSKLLSLKDWDENIGVLNGVCTSTDTRLADFLNDRLGIVWLAA